MTIILKPFALLLGWFYSLTGSYALSIILFALFFKIVLFPVSMKGRKSMLDMSRLSDRQKDLQQKYSRDRQRYSEELQKLYSAEGVKPSGGCLWSLIPIPVLMALFFIISQPFTYLMGLSTSGDGNQLARLVQFILGEESGSRSLQLGIAQQVYDRFSEVQAALPDIAAQIASRGGPIDFTFLGINLSQVPKLSFWQDGFSWGGLGLFLIPIFSALLALGSMMVSNAINRRVLGTVTKQDKTNRQMMIMQPLLSLWIGFTLPAALGVYWAANAFLSIVQEFVSVGILKRHVKEMRKLAEERTAKAREEERDKKKREAEAKKKKAEEARRIKMERKLSTDGISESRVGVRAYAKGRTFDQDRYPVTPYRDPDDIIRAQRAEREAWQAELAAKRGKKGQRGAEEENPAMKPPLPAEPLFGEEAAEGAEIAAETQAVSEELPAELPADPAAADEAEAGED